MSHLETNPTDSLHVALQAHKSLVSDYALRARQAEELASVLLTAKLENEQLVVVLVNRIQEHIEARGVERSVQYLGILQTTLLALTNIVQNNPSNTLRNELLEIVKALTVATN